MHDALVVQVFDPQEQLTNDALQLRQLEPQAGRQQPLQVVLGVLEHEVDLPAAGLVSGTGEGEALRGASRGNNLDQIDNILVVQLFEDFDLAHGSDWEALRVVVHLDHLQCVVPVRTLVGFDACLVHFAEGALADLSFVDEDGRLTELELVDRCRRCVLREPRLRQLTKLRQIARFHSY